ncbi:hypothetical protein N3K66_006701 [Trichothecium roseum]|uniref:Uncharacterized protein n=1 Tax=Trichothecium roseum TaxID=47278 RepID=A0ACC0UW41_9HYPO|nr:hypothetical protein N3K66_006701 [Trichothecium roseum]
MALLSKLLFLGLYALQATAAPRFLTPGRAPGLKLHVLHKDNTLTPSLPVDFPDPSIIQAEEGTWYAFATNTGATKVQVARTQDPLGNNWELLGHDAMPDAGWSSGSNTWAPDVRRVADGSYVLYFSGQVPGSHQHCIGVARSSSVAGPYKPDPEPWVCPRAQGGAIDASGFYDEAEGKRYVAYKVDGNSRGETPTACGEGVNDPTLRTPLVLQEVADDGVRKIGQPTVMIDRVATQDGALIEAPNLVRRGSDGMYVLFYSSHCFTDPLYDIKYAYSQNIRGPYTRSDGPLLKAPDFGLRAPGGMTSARLSGGQDFIVFHGKCQDKVRCAYSVAYDAQ